MTSSKTATLTLISPRLERMFAAIQVVLGGATVLACLGAAYAASSSIQRNPALLVLGVFAGAILFLTVVHEAGHLLAAHLAGMVVIGAKMGPFFLQARRRGWRIRWSTSGKRIGGFAMAYPNPAHSLRRQFILMIAGGPLANLFCAAILVIPALALPNRLARTACAALAIASVLTAVGNLVPTSKRFFSDGMQLLRWRRGLPDDDVGAIYVRLMGRSVFGTTADQLPETEIAALEAEPPPTCVIALWFRLKAAQNVHDWARASALCEPLDRSIDAMSAPQFASISSLVAIIRAEIAFAEAMRDRDPQKLDRATLSWADASWVRYFPPRVDALRAALSGDSSARDIALARSATLAIDTPDLALEKSESLIRGAIAALPTPVTDS